jgi:hypothetical protein
MWVMKNINITIQIQGSNLRLANGTPQELGVHGISDHVVLPASDIDVVLWLAGGLSRDEKQNVIQGVLAYLDKVDATRLIAA